MAQNPATSVDRADADADADGIVDYRGRFDLSHRRFLVLGGGQGMGRQTAHALTQLGASVIVADIDRERAARVCAEIGTAAESVQVDATDDADMAALATRAGQLDGVVDVIGMARYGPLLDSSITFVSSVSGIGSSPVHAAYGAYKAALGSLVRSATVELGPSGVRVNAVAPGFVLTPRISRIIDADALEQTRSRVPLRRVTMPADVAGALAFLVSDHARTITGQVVVIDGGATNEYPYDMSGFSIR